MNVAVKFHKDAPKYLGMPGEWPAEVRELGEGSAYLGTDPGPWTVMTLEAFQAYQAANQAAHDKYLKQYCNSNYLPHKVTSAGGLWVRIKHYLGLFT